MYSSEEEKIEKLIALQELENEVEIKYQLPKLAKNLVRNKKKVNYDNIQKL